MATGCVAAWNLTSTGLIRLSESAIAVEHDLGSRVENDPALVAEGLRFIGRQLPVEVGRLDLLGVDPQARPMLVEIKRGALNREAVSHALDHAASIASMTVKTCGTGSAGT